MIEINPIDREYSYNDPFSLYYIASHELYNDEQIKRAKEVSKKLKDILDEMVQQISDAEASIDWQDPMQYAADLIKMLGYAGVGVGDTSTDEAICYYVEKKLSEVFDAVDYNQIGHDFYKMIH